MRTRSSSRSASALASARPIGLCLSSPSAIWAPTRMAGLRAVIGSWKIMPIFAPRTCWSWCSLSRIKSTPSRTTRPSALISFGSSPRMARAIKDFPEPDSPTMPSVAPLGIVKETFSTSVAGCWRGRLSRIALISTSIVKPGSRNVGQANPSIRPRAGSTRARRSRWSRPALSPSRGPGSDRSGRRSTSGPNSERAAEG